MWCQRTSSDHCLESTEKFNWVWLRLSAIVNCDESGQPTLTQWRISKLLRIKLPFWTRALCTYVHVLGISQFLRLQWGNYRLQEEASSTNSRVEKQKWPMSNRPSPTSWKTYSFSHDRRTKTVGRGSESSNVRVFFRRGLFFSSEERMRKSCTIQ